MSAEFDTVSHEKLLDCCSRLAQVLTTGRTYVIADNMESGIMKLGLWIATRFLTWAAEVDNLRCRATGDHHSTLHLLPWIH